MYLLVSMLYDTGARISEIANLRIMDFSPGRNETGKATIFPIKRANEK